MRSKVLVARRSKRPNPNFWLRSDQNGSNFQEMGQISKFLPWREIFALEHDASGLESIPPGNFIYFGQPTTKNFNLVFLPDGQPEPGIAFLGATKWVKFLNFCPEERISLWNMTPVVSKVSLLEISSILAAPWPKITIRSF